MVRKFLDKLKTLYSGTDPRVLFSVSLMMLLFFASFLIYNQRQTGEWFERGLELRGGSRLTVHGLNYETSLIEGYLADNGIESSVRRTASATGYEIIIQFDDEASEGDIIDILNAEGIDTSSTSYSEIGPELGEAFWKQSRLALMIAFMFMAFVVYIVFRSLAPSIAIIYSSFTDIIGTLAMMQILNIPLTLASFAGLLLVLGYSIDTDIVLTTRVLKRRKGSIMERTFSAMETGITMTTTTLAALFVLYFATTAQALRDVAVVLIIALLIDFVSTWLGNASILRRWVEE